ncbi:CD276 antigen-like [Oncorhynchus masou masou]|uniref:CD276 antigen-like n=1 Tax=Oncorhynchus masou masou TaxID=90313 RepID=UPI0031838964
MTLVCTTHGGFPEHQVTWRTHNRTLERHEAVTKTTQDPVTGNYNISSRVNVTEGQNLTCSIYNPILNETQSNFIVIPASPAACENEVTGIIGESVLLSCDLKSSTAIDTARLRFHWQDESERVLYSFNKGEENQHQDSLYTNRTKAFGSEISSGNISIKLSHVTLEDKQKVYRAFATLFGEDDKHIHPCRTTLLVAARFPTPSVTVNKTNMNSTCSTQGGYPQPTVTWTIQDRGNRTLDPWEVQTNITLDSESGLYSAWSQVNITENQTVTCHIFNPVLRETVSNTTIVSPSINTDPAGCGARGGATGARGGATGARGGPQEPELVLQEPEVVLQEPEMGPQEPEVVLQEPEMVLQEPEMVLQEPEVVLQEPEVVLQEPEVVLQEPEVVLQEPEVVLQEPEVVLQEPEVVLQEPEVVLQEPEVVLQEPEMVPQEPEMVPQEVMRSRAF